MTTLPLAPLPAPLPGLVQANLICVASMFVWALGFPAVDVLLRVMPPLQLTAMRMALATAVLVPLWLFLDGPHVLARANWRRGGMVGAIGFGLGAFLLVYAQGRTDGVTVAVVTATMPVVAIAMECVLDARRLSRRLVIGLTLSLLGGFVAYAAGVGAIKFGPGAVAAFGSVIAFSWGSRATVVDFPGLSAVGRTAITIAGAALATGLVAGAQLAQGAAAVDWAGIGGRELALLALYGFGSLALSQVLWIMGVARLGVGVAGMHINAAPFYVMVLAALLGSAWNWTQAAGAVTVAAGVLVAQHPGRRRRP